MPPKRKAKENSHWTNLKRSRPEELFNDEHELPVSSTADQPRRSSRAGRGSGGSVQQLQNLERIQSAKSSRQATRMLELATQGQEINAMAPSHHDEYNDEESQIPAWVESSDPPTQVQPSFMLSQSSRFGFKPPSRTSESFSGRRTPSGRLPVENTTRSLSVVSSLSRPPSRSSSLSTSIVRPGTESTAPTSYAPSECGSNNDGVADLAAFRSRQPVSRLTMGLASSAVQSPDALRVQSLPATQRPSPGPSEAQGPDPTGTTSQGRFPSPRPPGLRATRSFRQLPSTLPQAHTITMSYVASDVGHGASPNYDRNRAGSPGVDEISPDEDDRFAESIVRNDRVPEIPIESTDGMDGDIDEATVPGLTDPKRNTEDVVAQYRQRNRAPHLPNNAHLTTIRNRQPSEGSRLVGRSRSATNNADEFENAALVNLRATSTPPAGDATAPALPHSLPASRSVSGAHDNGDASQLSFYPPTFRDIIERAKQFSHCDLATINSFPLRVQFNKKATEYMHEAIAEHHKRGLHVPEGLWPQYTDGIIKLLWEDIGNWRSSLKKKARLFVRERYEWDPQNRRAVNADLAKTLLDRGTFLKHGTDTEGHTNNLAHPTLSGLIIEFFYNGPSSLVNLFPEDFSNEVPRPAVALAATAIKLALDEIAMEGKEVMFKRDIYVDVYVDILGLMAKCDTNVIHRAKTKDLRVQWAKIGKNGSGTATSTGFDVDLD